jgi:nitrate/nitrite-specific signal transduction histidine kinase
MTANLRESYAGLERKVDERTHELRTRSSSRTAITEILARDLELAHRAVKPVLGRRRPKRAALSVRGDRTRAS